MQVTDDAKPFLGISRGFRRLSAVVSIPGLILVAYLATHHNTLYQCLSVFAVLVGVPAITTLLVGWVVAGFRST
jgi:hypothetical protein